MIRNLRREIIELSHATQEGHVASALSILDLVWTLYDEVLEYDHAHEEDRDRFVLSKGHGCLALYAVLAAKGFITRDELKTFCAPDTRLEGHPNSLLCPGVEFTTGSLGHGICGAVGMAMALKLKRSLARVFCLIGDGECSEGTVWESAALASRFALDNLTVIVDHNHSSPVPMNLSQIFDAFKWSTTVINGHERQAITRAISAPHAKAPRCIVAYTIKGQGCEAMEEFPEMWHHRSPKDDKELAELLEGCK